MTKPKEVWFSLHLDNREDVQCVLVHRSDVYEIDNSKIVFPLHFDIWLADPEDCPLCAQGLKRLKQPKVNWAELTGKKQ